jgi:hypothetical protein
LFRGNYTKSFASGHTPLANIWQSIGTLANIWQSISTLANIWQSIGTLANIWQSINIIPHLVNKYYFLYI